MKTEVEELVGKEFPCLDKGFVRLVDVMGDDSSIVQAARVSYGKGTKSLNEDRGLIRYLMRHRHTTPFEMVEFKFHIKLPIFIARQWIRHRTANVNEYSGRYSEMKDDFYLPEPEQIRHQSSMNKQGRSDEALPESQVEEIRNILNKNQTQSFSDYKKMLDLGLAREIARISLPVANYTEWYWKIDLHNLLHFLKLRLDSHAQYEIQVYSQIIAEIVKIVTPYAWESFEDYELNSVYLSKQEIIALKKIIDFKLPENDDYAANLSKREISDLLDKINKINKIL